MARCQKCKAEIDKLLNTQSGYLTYDFDGEEYEANDFEADNSVNDWRCPSCDEVIATTEEEAIKFLEQKEEDYAIDEMIEGQIDEAIEAKADLRRKYGE